MKVVHHIDGNPRNNHPSNLRMVDMNENHAPKTIEGELMPTSLTHTATDGLNKEEIWKLADHLDEVYKTEQYFDMGEFFKNTPTLRDPETHETLYKCDSPSCMAGHYLAMKGFKTISSHESIEGRVGNMLGMSPQDAYDLFLPSTPENEDGEPVCDFVYHANARQCAYLLRHYVETGKVDWQKAMSIEELK